MVPPPPGNVQLVQETSDGNGNIVLIPTPSDDINDPLRWSQWEKAWFSFALLLWTFLGNAVVAFSSPAWGIWVVELPTSFEYLTYGQASLVLMCGLGVLFMQPWAVKYGRRSTFILGSIFILVGLAFGRQMESISFWFVFQVLAGFGSAPAFATIMTTIMDVSFLHQKGRMLSLCGMVMIAGNFLPPLAAGYIIEAQGWEWCLNYLLIFFGLVTLIICLGVEESLFPREPYDSSVINGTRMSADGTDGLERTTMPTKDDSIAATGNEMGLATQLTRNTSLVQSEAAEYQRHSYLHKITLYRRDPMVTASYWQLLIQAFSLLALPAVLWTSVQLALSTFVVGVALTTQAAFFVAPPYNFSPSMLGLMYLAIIVGSVVGSILGGPVADTLILALARRNRGVFKPEQRLWIYIPISFIASAGVLLYGVGAAEGLHWMVPCVGFFLIGVFLSASLPITIGYALDCYPEREGGTLQISNDVRNVVGGAFTFGLQPWINYNGAKTTCIVIAIITLVICISSVGFLIWGSKIRQWTKGRYSDLVLKTLKY